jgi:hypothetical protein
MTITGNCPADCPHSQMAACLTHDANVPEAVLAERLRQHLAEWNLVRRMNGLRPVRRSFPIGNEEAGK